MAKIINKDKFSCHPNFVGYQGCATGVTQAARFLPDVQLDNALTRKEKHSFPFKESRVQRMMISVNEAAA